MPALGGTRGEGETLAGGAKFLDMAAQADRIFVAEPCEHVLERGLAAARQADRRGEPGRGLLGPAGNIPAIKLIGTHRRDLVRPAQLRAPALGPRPGWTSSGGDRPAWSSQGPAATSASAQTPSPPAASEVIAA